MTELAVRKLPGTAEPMPGKCGAKLHGFNEPEDPRFGRYCGNGAGAGTSHKGEGTCKMHLGNTQKHLRHHERNAVEKEVRSLAEILGEPAPLDNPYEALFLQAGKIKQWDDILTQKVAELSSFTIVDMQGVERSRALVEAFERSLDRSVSVYVNIIKLGILEYKAKILDQHAQLLQKICINVIEDPSMGLTDAQILQGKILFRDAINENGGRLIPEWITAADDDDDDDDEIFDGEVV